MRSIPSRNRSNVPARLVPGMAACATIALVGTAAVGQGPGNVQSFRNTAGILRTTSTTGGFDRSNPFFNPLGKAFAVTCEHCHFAADGWGLSQPHAQQLFNSTSGTHPLFTPPTSSDPVSAAVAGNVDTVAKRRTMYNLMVDKGLSLVRRNFNPATADFTVLGVKPPAGFALGQTPTMIPAPDTGEQIIDGTWYLNYTAAANAGAPQIWIYRRPLPTTNLPFVTTASWDGQDTRQAPDPIRRPTIDGFADVTRGAIKGRQTTGSFVAPDGHVYSQAEQDSLVSRITNFIFSTTTSQDYDNGVGSLSANGAHGGLINLFYTTNYYGINDVLEGDFMVVPGPTPGTVREQFSGRPFNAHVMSQYDAWAGDSNPQRASIARGQALFNQTNRMLIDDVNGIQSYDRLDGVVGGGSTGLGTTGATITLPDSRVIPGLTGPVPGSLAGCVTCHDAPNVGDHSTRLPINIGIGDVIPAGSNNNTDNDLNNLGLPVFYLQNKATGEIIKTTDPARAVISGKWAHIGQTKGPFLHGLVNRAPFFHNGAAKTLDAVVDFYNARFHANFTAQEKADLVAFLRTL
jgi:cytochrome c peroxidase